MPLFGPPNVRRLQGKGNVKGLIKALSYDKDPDVPRRAALALGALGDGQAVQPLIATLDSGRVEVRQAAAQALGMIGGPAAVRALVGVLHLDQLRVHASEALVRIGQGAVGDLVHALGKSKYLDVARAAAQALASIRDRRAIEPLVSALTHRYWGVRGEAANALDQLGWVPGQDARGATYWMAKGDWGRCGAVGARAVPILAWALKDRNKEIRRQAAWTLGHMGEREESLAALTGALNDSNELVRIAASEALVRVGGSLALTALEQALRDPKYRVYKATLAALAGDGSTQAIRVLEEEARSTRDTASGANYTRSYAHEAVVEAMAALGPRAVDALLEVLQKGGSESARLAAVDRLGAMDHPRIARALLDALHDPAPRIRESAARALSQSGTEVAASLIAALGDEDPGVRKAAAVSLGNAGPPGVPDLIRLLDDKLEVRMAAAVSLQDLYRSGRLTEADRLRILEQKGRLASLHVDRSWTAHSDDPLGAQKYSEFGPWFSDCAHLDKTETYHTDEGANIQL